MRFIDGSISIDHPNLPDNKQIESSKSLTFDLTGIIARCPRFADCAPDKMPHVFSDYTPLWNLSDFTLRSALAFKNGTFGRKLEWFYMARFDDRKKRICEFQIVNMREVSTPGLILWSIKALQYNDLKIDVMENVVNTFDIQETLQRLNGLFTYFIEDESAVNHL